METFFFLEAACKNTKRFERKKHLCDMPQDHQWYDQGEVGTERVHKQDLTLYFCPQDRNTRMNLLH